jgi:hypothetical protein
MAVPGLESEAVIDNDQVAVRALIPDMNDAAGGRRVDRRALVADDVEAGVEVVIAVHRIAPRAHPR